MAQEYIARRPRLPTRARACLRCRRRFKSEGAHNRLCESCRDYATNVSPFEPEADTDQLG